jgi:hypothetical protein
MSSAASVSLMIRVLALTETWDSDPLRVPETPPLHHLRAGFSCRVMALLQHSAFFVRIKRWRPNFSPGGEDTHLCERLPKLQAPPSGRGFFF